jgi:Protein of unknown function DUF262
LKWRPLSENGRARISWEKWRREAVFAWGRAKRRAPLSRSFTAWTIRGKKLALFFEKRPKQTEGRATFDGANFGLRPCKRECFSGVTVSYRTFATRPYPSTERRHSAKRGTWPSLHGHQGSFWIAGLRVEIDMAGAGREWFEDYAEESDDLQIDEYDITASPNDFNVSTLYNFVESGAVRIPGFQRNFVWDKVRSSKLIESLILGIPVPQLFLYEQQRNRFLVIDGQQRLMSIYYFIKRRFPKRDKRSELRIIFDKEGKIPEDILHSDDFFEDFNLKLTEKLPNKANKFNGRNYSTLADYKTQLDLRPIRNIVIKQNAPAGDDSSVYEVFSRLNTGGINLRPQEIRTSMYHSEFYDMLYRIN